MSSFSCCHHHASENKTSLSHYEVNSKFSQKDIESLIDKTNFKLYVQSCNCDNNKYFTLADISYTAQNNDYILCFLKCGTGLMLDKNSVWVLENEVNMTKV
jgi:hypothetical protein